MTKLKAALPPYEVNGLHAIREQLLDSPETRHVAIILFDVVRITEDVVDGERVQTPTIRILRFEPETDPDRAAVLVAHARELTDARLPPPQPPLPGLGDIDGLISSPVQLHAVPGGDDRAR